VRIVVALGGNALQRRGEPMTVDGQRANVAEACRALAPVAADHELVVTHGNGPQVGLLALQAAAYDDVSSYPFDVLGAQTRTEPHGGGSCRRRRRSASSRPSRSGGCSTKAAS